MIIPSNMQLLYSNWNSLYIVGKFETNIITKKSIIFILILGFLAGCCIKEAEENDALRAVVMDAGGRETHQKQLLEEMRTELYSSRFYQVKMNNDLIICAPYIQPRNVLHIQQDSAGQLMIDSESRSDIFTSIRTYFTVNMDKNDVTNNYPMYAKLSRSVVKEHLKEARESKKVVEETPGASEEIIEFKVKQVESWEHMLRLFDVLDTNEISQPHFQAKVVIDYQLDEQGSVLIDSALYAFYELREIVSKRYLHESYLKIYIRYSLEQREEDRDKMEAIKLLMPLAIVDKPYCRANNIWLGEVATPAPPPPVELIE